MKIFAVHDSKFGNGEILAKTFGQVFNGDEVRIAHHKKISPKDVVKASPDVLIVGTAVRIFRISGSSKRWLKKLQKLLQKSNQTIDFGICFVTHMRDVNKISSKAHEFHALLKNRGTITHIYPDLILAQVQDIEGPLKEGVLDNISKVSDDVINWIQGKNNNNQFIT
ncbi:MAG: hypothetical protein ACXAD7_05410 [Candidatus Kariarchaeaceae archaeon]|jgi:hypothetical protein